MSRRWFVLPAVVGLVAALFAPTTALASDPAESTITVPSSPGETEPATWTGTVGAPDSHPTSDCTEPEDGGATHDTHDVTLNVPTLNEDLTYEVEFTVTWQTDLHRRNDLMFTILNAEGEVVANVDSASTKEQIAVEELPPGSYTIEVCGFDNLTPQEYAGSVVARTMAPAVIPPPAPSQGLAFSASVPADIQRDEGEPLIEIDGNGRIYTCGPTGVSQTNDYIQVSTDGGDQFHLLGEPPRGELSLGGGGGDCALGLSPTENDDGFHHLSYVGLTLAEFATFVSPDGGHTFTEGTPLSGTGPLVDRQWVVATSDDRVHLNFNRVEPRNTEVCRSTDGGVTYGDCQIVAPDPLFPGPMKAIMPEDHDLSDQPLVYFPWTDTADDTHPNMVLLAVSTDDGETWNNCRVGTSRGAPGQSFAVADHDAEGEAIYVVWTDRADFNTYMATVRVDDLTKCNGGTTEPDDFKTTNPGATSPVVVNRDGIPTTVFPWIAARGEPGRVAVTFYGTPTGVEADAVDDPESTEDDRTWNVYVNQSLNALDPDPAFSQVRATTHPNHYGQICLLGLGCAAGGDRSLVDFFAVDLNPTNGELVVVYNRAHKRPSDSVGTVSTPIVVRQIAGPSNQGGTVSVADREPLRDVSIDPPDDAVADYSSLITQPMLNYVAAADLTRVEILPPIDPESGDPFEEGGFTVRLHVKDLSDGALQQALQDSVAQSLIFMFRFVDGFRYESVQANWEPVRGFTFGHSEYGATAWECGSGTGSEPVEGNQCLTYTGENEIAGAVDQEAGTITMTAPLDMLEALEGLPAGPAEHPEEVPAEAGDRIYTATAFVMANAQSGDDQVQSWMVPLDNAPSMDFLIPAPATDGTDGGGGDPDGAPDGDDGPMPDTGGGVALVGLLALVGAAALRRR